MHQLVVHGSCVEPVEWEAVRRVPVREPRPELAQQVDFRLLGPAHRRAAFPSSLKLLRDLRARAHVGSGSVATPRRDGTEHMCCGCAHHVVQPLAVRRDIHLLRALLTVRLTRTGGVACRFTRVPSSHSWVGACAGRVACQYWFAEPTSTDVFCGGAEARRAARRAAALRRGAISSGVLGGWFDFLQFCEYLNHGALVASRFRALVRCARGPACARLRTHARAHPHVACTAWCFNAERIHYP